VLSAEAGDGADVSAYLPDAPGQPGFVRFVPGPSKTPALRSGTIDPAAPYTFNLPKDGRFKEAKVANAISGNYCQPRCDEVRMFAVASTGISRATDLTLTSSPAANDGGYFPVWQGGQSERHHQYVSYRLCSLHFDQATHRASHC